MSVTIFRRFEILMKGVAFFEPTKKLANMSKIRYLNLYLRKTSNGLTI